MKIWGLFTFPIVRRTLEAHRVTQNDYGVSRLNKTLPSNLMASVFFPQFFIALLCFGLLGKEFGNFHCSLSIIGGVTYIRLKEMYIKPCSVHLSAWEISRIKFFASVPTPSEWPVRISFSSKETCYLELHTFLHEYLQELVCYLTSPNSHPSVVTDFLRNLS